MIHIRATWSVDAGDKRQLLREVWEGVGGGAVGLSQVAPTFKSFLALCALAGCAYLGVGGCPNVRVSHADNFHLEEKNRR